MASWPISAGPRAHEDDAERAVRTGLALVDAVGRLGEPKAEPNIADRLASSGRRVPLRSTRPTISSAGDGTPLAARVGIATGIAAVGDLIGEGASREEAVVGEVPNLAARLQALAKPSGVVIRASPTSACSASARPIIRPARSTR
jgi:class 3 adenylate cyclase